MISRFLLVAALLGPAGAFAAEENQAQQPPEAQPAPQVPADPYMDLNKQVQEKLQALGLYDGPVNGDFGFYTQAALAQFQLSVPLPASGMLDEETIAALGIRREATASVGASQQPPADQPEQPPADQAEQPATQLDGSSQGTVEASAKER